MNRIEAVRCLTLANFLDELPMEKWNFDTWVGGQWQGNPDLSCGTTACAFGWAATIPEFQALGLRLQPSNSGVGGFPTVDDDLFQSSHYAPPRAARVIFGLSGVEYDMIFTYRGYEGDEELEDENGDVVVTPVVVAKTLRRYAYEYFPELKP